MSDRPRTVVVDVPRLSGPPGLFLVGCFLTAAGVLLRVSARKLAWPKEWYYSGDRANTDWAYAESVYIDIGIALLVFGLALVFLAIVRMTAPRSPQRTSEPS